jgi:hypothetical protein
VGVATITTTRRKKRGDIIIQSADGAILFFLCDVLFLRHVSCGRAREKRRGNEKGNSREQPKIHIMLDTYDG